MKGRSKRKQIRAGLRTAGVLMMLMVVTLLLAACSTENDGAGIVMPSTENGKGNQVRETPTESQGNGQPGEQPGPVESDVRNGERIYFTAENDKGERITYSGGPEFGGMMMGSYLTCASCHGPEAQGGRHIMHMQVMDAPAISYSALNGEDGQHHDEDGEAEDHGGEAGEYDLEDFRMAVVEGQHPNGAALDENMPRWNIQEEDLSDLFAFLKQLP